MNESDLISVAQAIEIIDSVPLTPRIARIKLAEAQGLRLAQDVKSDRDYPPFDKSLMDGYAVRCADVKSTPVELEVVGEIAAGSQPARALGAGEAFAIMTGAPIPQGADGVVPVEDVLPLPPASGELSRTGEGGGEGRRDGDPLIKQESSGPRALILTFSRREKGPERIRILRADGPHRFVSSRGADCPAGAVVLKQGTKLEAAQLAVAASVGASEVDVFAKPRVAVLSTGDELIPIDSTPGPSQIRNSNNIMLTALLRRLGCEVLDLGTARDDYSTIRGMIDVGYSHDILFVSGGMSMGKYDFVPKALIDLGVALKITKLKIKPGKPFVFGAKSWSGTTVDQVRRGRESYEPWTSYVFGLPGNPVSAFVCTLRLASRLIARVSGSQQLEKWVSASLEGPLEPNGVREFYQPGVLDDVHVTPLKWKGSADIYTLAQANALIVRPENSPALDRGQVVDVLEVPS